MSRCLVGMRSYRAYYCFCKEIIHLTGDWEERHLEGLTLASCLRFPDLPTTAQVLFCHQRLVNTSKIIVVWHRLMELLLWCFFTGAPKPAQANASGEAFGAVLSQKKKGQERPVAYARWKLNEHQRRPQYPSSSVQGFSSQQPEVSYVGFQAATHW
ncbi:hypothetical protein Y1Q_0016181 [Alligator mississippiensis]|uniref:Reverse transcriptase RNase H-like domain-containing protein n=1 Tax=Alligator mississippiensis TaxID=8496 RepID=A0A151P126_ALLMI|nr:hypothetical protein Y1Q_0016181 [Alligator mississippiensis]